MEYSDLNTTKLFEFGWYNFPFITFAMMIPVVIIGYLLYGVRFRLSVHWFYSLIFAIWILLACFISTFIFDFFKVKGWVDSNQLDIAVGVFKNITYKNRVLYIELEHETIVSKVYEKPLCYIGTPSLRDTFQNKDLIKITYKYFEDKLCILRIELSRTNVPS